MPIPKILPTVLSGILLLSSPVFSFAAPFRLAVIELSLDRDRALVQNATVRALKGIFPDGIEMREYAYDELEKAVTEDKADAVLGTAGHLFRIRATRLRPVATIVHSGAENPNRNEGTAVVVRRDREELKTLKDLQRKSAIANSPLGFAGYMLVLGEIAKFYPDPWNFFFPVRFTGSAQGTTEILRAVLQGKTDAGLVRLCAFEDFASRYPEEARNLRVLENRFDDTVSCAHSTDLYPGFTLAVTPSVSPETAKRISLALFSMKETAQGSSWSMPTDFQRIDALYRSIKAGPYAYLREWSLQGLLKRYRWWFGGFFASFGLLLLLYWRVVILVRRREDQIRQQAAELAQLQRSGTVSQLSGLFAHEMRQPLTAVSLYAETLNERLKKGTVSTEKLIEITEKIVHEADRASRIVESVRAYAKGHHQERIVLEAQQVASRALDLWTGTAGFDVPVALSLPKEKLLLKGNQTELELVFVNLLKNAKEALSNAPVKKIRFSLAQKGSELIFTVSDSGTPPHEETLNQLGQPRQSAKQDGLGLGLMISRGIVESHGGTLFFTHSADPVYTGLSVLVTLPMYGNPP